MADAKNMERVIEDAFKSARLGRVHRRLRVFFEWNRIVGETNARQARPVSLRGGVLTIACLDAVWADKFRYLEDTFLRRIAEQIGPGHVNSLRFTVGASRIPRRKKPAPPPLSAREKSAMRAVIDGEQWNDRKELQEDFQALYESILARRRTRRA